MILLKESSRIPFFILSIFRRKKSFSSNFKCLIFHLQIFSQEFLSEPSGDEILPDSHPLHCSPVPAYAVDEKQKLCEPD